VSVTHALEKGQYDQCHACRLPITEEDKKSDKYIQGVSCHHCYDKKTDEQRLRFMQREKQVQLAKSRGEPHIGSDMTALSKQRKTLKYQARQPKKQQTSK